MAAATEGVAQRLAANREVEVARNGYDEEEVASVRREVSGSSRSSRFRLCHVGSMYVLNGGTAFLDGLACAVSRSKEFAREASVAFIGDADVSFRDAVVRRGLSGTASFAGASSHDAGLREAASSEAGLVLVGEYPGAWARLPVKLYEYLGLGLPVVAVAPEGLCDRIVRDAGGIVARPGDPEGICAALLSAHGDWRAGRLRACGDPGRLYTRRASVRILAGLLDRACAGRPASGTLDPMRGGRS
ncbi:MAG: glycosyltransferase [Planctomycetes bacterium]|nr:glycosyltransferase [Planctomycetota bacterium]